MIDVRPINIIYGPSHPQLAQQIGQKIGIEPVPYNILSYRNGCIEACTDLDLSGSWVFIIDTMVPHQDQLHTNLFALFGAISACRASDAYQTTVVIPHFSYARSDKPWRDGMGVAAKTIMDFLVHQGMQRFVGIDLHSQQVVGFLPPNVPRYCLSAERLLIQYIQQQNPSKDSCLLLPGDQGFAKHTEKWGESLDTTVGDVEKIRNGSGVKIIAVHGEVQGRRVFIADDEILEGSTMRAIADYLIEQGAASITALATAGLFQGAAKTKLSQVFSQIVISDVVPIGMDILAALPIKVVGVAEIISDCIKKICRHD